MGANRRVLVVEREPMVATLLADSLMTRGHTVRTAVSVEEARRAALEFKPHAVVIDVHLGEETSGIDLARSLMKKHAVAGVVFLTHIANPRLIGASTRSIPANAAYLDKRRFATVDQLTSAIEASINREVTEEHRDDKNAAHKFSSLSRAHIEVLRMVALGMSNAEIAVKRGTSIRAVERLVQRASEAIGAGRGEAGNARVLAARAFIEAVGVPQAS